LVTVSELSTNLKALLRENDIENSAFEARCILEHALGLTHEKILASAQTAVTAEQTELVREIAQKRISGYPLQYILGKWEFFGLPFYVGEGVLIPRQDTETLVEAVLENSSSVTAPEVLDLCSGSGCIAVALEKNIPGSKVAAVEYSKAALEYLIRNASLNDSQITIYEGDVLDRSFAEHFHGVNIITANPPYLTAHDMSVLQKEVSYEPDTALYGGDDGLMFYREITAVWKNCLADNGMLFFEIGIHQDDDVSDILRQNGFTDIKKHHDLCGIIRVVSGVYNR
jgi:release factor glutamine methyltransferase